MLNARYISLVNKPSIEIRHTVQNLALGPAAYLKGMEETREYLAAIGAGDGLAWAPTVRSRLYAEMRVAAAIGAFKNTSGDTRLIASLEQSYAPTIPESWDRYKSRAGVMPQLERLKRLSKNILQQRGAMPPVLASLGPMARVAHMVNDTHLFGNLYAEELPTGQSYDHTVAPYVRSAQLTPDLTEKLGTTVKDLPDQLGERGITTLSFSSYNAARHPQTGKTTLAPWESYLADFTTEGLIRQVTVSFNRKDLPKASGVEAMQTTHTLASRLVQDSVRISELGSFPDQLACIAENLPTAQPLDLCLSGDLTAFKPHQLQNAYHNLDDLIFGR